MADDYVAVFERSCKCNDAGNERIEVRGEVQIHWCNRCDRPTVISISGWSDDRDEMVPEETTKTVLEVIETLLEMEKENEAV